jgi:Ca2+-binding RTX toxin-like protein
VLQAGAPAAVNATGNGGNNALRGNALGNRLDGGAGNDSIAGGAGADTLLGSAGNDTLRGEAGVDQLQGGAGGDVFVFDAADGERDVVRDFNGAVDTLELRSAGFAGLAPGVLAQENFAAKQGPGATAASGTAQAVYDLATGDLWFDPDGAGAAAGVVFARLQGDPDAARRGHRGGLRGAAARACCVPMRSRSILYAMGGRADSRTQMIPSERDPL